VAAVGKRPTEIRIYYEGDKALTPGFAQFFSQIRDKAKESRCKFSLISGKSGPEACQDFETALKTHKNAWNILLKDSEGPDHGTLSASLCDEQAWDKSHSDSIFWMVQMMESWFHADKEALETFYGADFRKNALKQNPKVEEILKADLTDGLRKATNECSKGSYNKTSHGPRLLASINPAKVQQAAPKCKRLFETILNRLVPGSHLA
jgi:hypothetical protein